MCKRNGERVTVGDADRILCVGSNKGDNAGGGGGVVRGGGSFSV